MEKFCQHCLSSNLVEILETQPSIHYARLTCGDCQRYFKWLPHPQNAPTPSLELVPEKSPTSVIKLLRYNNLLEWERSFLKALAHRSHNKAEAIVITAIKKRLNIAYGVISHTQLTLDLQMESDCRETATN